MILSTSDPKRRPILPWIAFAVFLFGLARSSQARWKPGVELSPLAGGLLLSINHRPAILFENLDAPWAMPNRPQWVAEHLRNLIDKGFNPGWIGVKDTPHGSIIVTGAGNLLTVSDSEAHAKGLTRQSLALTWARTLRELLTVPPLTVDPASLVIPVGESRAVDVGGSALGVPRFACDPEEFATARMSPDHRRITLDGMAPGHGTLKVSIQGVEVSVEFDVKKYAGTVHDGFLSVTGNGPDRSELLKLVTDTVERNLDVEPDAVVHLANTIDVPRTIPVQGAQVTVPVLIDGGDYLPVRADAHVRLVHEEVGRTEPNLLFYSNNPEMLHKYGVLYTGVIKSNQAVRLLYHHQSAMSEPVRFVLELKNGSTPARIQIIDGSATPMVDTFQIGHRAAARFIPCWLSDSGYVQSLDPGESLVLLDQRLGHDDTTSGLFHFVMLAGSSVTVQLRAEPPDSPTGMLPARPNPEVYAVTRKKVTMTYTVGGRWSFIPFGRDPVRADDSSHPLRGDYGVEYDLTLKMVNPTDQRNAADVVFDPAAGVARGVFVVDGKLEQTDLLQPPQEYTLCSCPLEPGESKEVHVLTMPLAGSNYPARFIVRPRYTVAKRR